MHLTDPAVSADSILISNFWFILKMGERVAVKQHLWRKGLCEEFRSGFRLKVMNSFHHNILLWMLEYTVGIAAVVWTRAGRYDPKYLSRCTFENMR